VHGHITSQTLPFRAPLFHRSSIARARIATARLFLAEAASLEDVAEDMRIRAADRAGLRRRARSAGRTARRTLQDLQ